MKHNLKSLVGYTLTATDGEIGKVVELYFDDHTWTIRYLIVETGSWLFGRKVLISPTVLLTPDWVKKTFPVNLTKKQIKKSPDINTEEPVSLQQEIALSEHYSWPSYWGGSFYPGAMTPSMYLIVREENENTPDTKIKGDPHLRSTHSITGYDIQATDGKVGDLEDFLMDDKTWKIDFIVVDTGNWLPGKKVLLSPKWIKEVNWYHSTVIINSTVDKIKNSPEYDPNQNVSENYENQLHDHYGEIVSHTL